MFICIDTSSQESGITLICRRDSRIAPTNYIKLEYNNFSEGIISAIDKLISPESANIHSRLHGIFVIQGPGSFTGLRVGITVANQFAHQLNIPIIPIRMEEFYRHRTDEKDFFYVQTMNKSEVYVIGFGKYENQFEEKIIDIDSFCHLDWSESEMERSLYIGEFKYDHREKLGDQNFKLEEIENIKSIEDTWVSIIKSTKLELGKKYDLVQPYYGKNPSITKAKKKLSI